MPAALRDVATPRRLPPGRLQRCHLCGRRQPRSPLARTAAPTAAAALPQLRPRSGPPTLHRRGARARARFRSRPLRPRRSPSLPSRLPPTRPWQRFLRRAAQLRHSKRSRYKAGRGTGRRCLAQRRVRFSAGLAAARAAAPAALPAAAAVYLVAAAAGGPAAQLPAAHAPRGVALLARGEPPRPALVQRTLRCVSSVNQGVTIAAAREGK